MTFTNVRIVIGLLGLLGVGLWLWNIVIDPIADGRAERAVASYKDKQRQDTKEQVEDEKREQDQQRHDARTSEAARREIRRVDSVGDGWSNCPPVPADFTRMLNSIGKEPSASGLAGTLPSEAETAGD